MKDFPFCEKDSCLVRDILDASDNGFLLIGVNSEVFYYNRKFREIWGIPKEVAEEMDDLRFLSMFRDRLTDPESFFNGVEALYALPVPGVYDILYFKDGRIIERLFTPLEWDGAHVAYCWTFRDATNRDRLARALQSTELKLQYTKLLLATTPREREVLELIGEGLTSADIAKTLKISIRTVDTHRANLAQKLKLNKTLDLAQWTDVLKRSPFLKEKKPWRVTAKGGIIEAVCIGDMTDRDLKELFVKIALIQQESASNRVVLDASDLILNASLPTLLDIPNKLFEAIKLPKTVRVAIVTPTDEAALAGVVFLIDSCETRAWSVRGFNARASAIKWLTIESRTAPMSQVSKRIIPTL